MGDSLVEQVKAAMPPEDDLFEVAELFKAFGDSTRAKIICALSQSELCVGDLAQLLEMNQSAVSHQLRLLKQARLVKTRRDGKVRYYSLADEHIQEMFKVAFEHVMEE
ncbi:metalloregulator ArsR/SmtB family transcription factor [Frisingicoccus sp.]|jgi:DNA-binding transcriptional ArsR family regulator|uniref:ArsR/SmtB family transcription factor n=1 Tax=Frisingicoccus sp. TaxID=1918627 RepID=UPI0015BC803D